VKSSRGIASRRRRVGGTSIVLRKLTSRAYNTVSSSWDADVVLQVVEGVSMFPVSCVKQYQLQPSCATSPTSCTVLHALWDNSGMQRILACASMLACAPSCGQLVHSAIHAARSREADGELQCNGISYASALLVSIGELSAVQHPRRAPTPLGCLPYWIPCTTASRTTARQIVLAGQQSRICLPGLPPLSPSHDELKKKHRQLQHTSCICSLFVAIGIVSVRLAGQVND